MDVSPARFPSVIFYSTPVKVPFTMAKVIQPAMVHGNDPGNPWVTYAAGVAPAFNTNPGSDYSFETFARGIMLPVPNYGKPWSGAPDAPADSGPPSSDNPTITPASEMSGTQIDVVVVTGLPPTTDIPESQDSEDSYFHGQTFDTKA